jgi:hypothetical protein
MQYRLLGRTGVSVSPLRALPGADLHAASAPGQAVNQLG